MTPQEYFDKLVQEAGVSVEKSDQIKTENSEFFKNLAVQQDDLDYEKLMNCSMVISDTQVLYTKIASLVYFYDKLGIEIDTVSASTVKGLQDFLMTYKPFETNTIVKEDGTLEVKKDDYAEKLRMFRNNFKALSNLKNAD